MKPIIYTCPMTGHKVEALVDETMIDPKVSGVAVDCPICQRPHLVDPATFEKPDDG